MSNATPLTETVERFFADPAVEPAIPGRVSVLHLLRRDVRGCMEGNQFLFPATMAVFAGVDLLAKFYAGEDQSGVGQRFTRFVAAYFQPISAQDASILWLVRNALMHSFGLRVNGHALNLVSHMPFLIGRDRNNPNTVLVSTHGLYACFERAVERYRQDVLARPELQRGFEDMHEKYGFITMGKVKLEQIAPPPEASPPA